MPSHWTLLFREQHYALTEAMHALRRAFSKHHESGAGTIRIDFSKTARLYPEGTLLFYAELTRLIEAFPQVSLTCVPASVSKVEQVLKHLGIYEKLGHTSQINVRDDDVVNWRHGSGVLVEGEQAGRIIEGISQADSHLQANLFRSVSEAMTNVVNHSSIERRQDGLHLDPSKRWWLFTRVDGRRLYVAVCDLGIGIPRSLLIHHPRDQLLNALTRIFRDASINDAKLIQASLRMGKSRTDQSYRGKGFADILRVLGNIPGSSLLILSNAGGIEYRQVDDRPVYKIQQFKTSVLGTMLIWSFPLEGEDNEY